MSCALPLILMVSLDPASFVRLNGLRQRYFPHDRRVLPAHLTVFHALPTAQEDAICNTVREVAAQHEPLSLQFSGVRFLGRGVAVEVVSPQLVGLCRHLRHSGHLGSVPKTSSAISPRWRSRTKSRRALPKNSTPSCVGFGTRLQAKARALWHGAIGVGHRNSSKRPVSLVDAPNGADGATRRGRAHPAADGLVVAHD